MTDEVQTVTQAVRGQMPKIATLRRMIQRVHTEARAAPAAPRDLQSMVIPDAYNSYESVPGQTENFLLVDTGPGPNRILIFGRDGNMAWCGEIEVLDLDGTCKQAPPLFHQVYIILAERNGYVVPLLYALLPNKRAATYRLLFQSIAQKWPTLQAATLPRGRL